MQKYAQAKDEGIGYQKKRENIETVFTESLRIFMGDQVNNYQKIDQNLVNHIALVLDSSSSMDHLTRQTVEVADGTVAELADRSKDLDQETRATVYTFADQTSCIYYDKDVLRLPSLNGKYKPYGNTALIDGTLKAIEDLEKSATLYGDHGFLIYVLTDGQENRSRRSRSELKKKLESLPDNWTVAVLVPDKGGFRYAVDLGFFAGNILIWDTSSAKGMLDVGEKIKASTAAYMQGRTLGTRGTRTLFDVVDVKNVKIEQLQPMKQGDYLTVIAGSDIVIKDLVESTGLHYIVGQAYYELVKTEEVQPSKLVCLYDENKRVMYHGQGVRDQLGIKAGYTKVKPGDHKGYAIFVQSTSLNRKIPRGTRVMIERV